ncbi:MAG: carboxypeptidase regulatory-like domain-containing protein [Acidobacteriia bacterium]|nr:carboxypeptidase regulatory-like domain-containing protein [Terriglobia bacterium]
MRPRGCFRPVGRAGDRFRSGTGLWALLLGLLFFMGSIRPGLAQVARADVVGVVVSPSGERLAGVQVRLVREGSQALISATPTGVNGGFRFLAIPPGVFTLEATRLGWRELREAHVEIRSGSALDIRIMLSPLSAPSRASVAEVRNREVDWGTMFEDSRLRRLPNSGNLWSLVESQAPTTVTNRIDVGGLATGVPALFGALGASWTENQYSLHGFNVTDPYVPGRPLIDPDLDAVSELLVTTGAKPAPFGASGVNLTLSTPPPGAAFHGSTRWFYSDGSLQSHFSDARLARFQFPGPERFRHFADGNVQLGGKLPIPSASWPFFASLSTQQLSKTLGGFNAPMDVHVYRALTEVTPLSRGRSRLDLLYSGQHIFNSHEGADPRIAADSTTRGNDNYHQVQARGEHLLNPNAWLAAGFGVVHAIVSSGFEPGLAEPSALDLPQMTRTGAAPLSTAGTRTRYEAHALIQAVRDGPVGSHNLTLGGEWERNFIANRWDALGGLERTEVAGVGSEVTLWNTPSAARSHTQNVAIFAHDAWRPTSWLSLPLGLRLDSSSGRAAGVASGIRWTTLEPRAGLVLPLRRRGPTLRASWARYGHLLQGRYLDFGNPAALGGQVFRWDDANADLAFEAGEISTLLRRFGGPYSAIDPGLARPFTDEVSVGLEQELGSGFRAGVRFFRRDTHRRIAVSNVGVPFADYTPVNYLDPGNDGIPGTADDQVLALYNRNPGSLGQDFLLLTNPPGLHGSFKGFEVRLAKPLRRVWEFEASFTAMRTLAATSPGNSVFENDPGFVGALGTDPNTFVLDASRTYFDRAFIGKASGYYFAPKGFQVGCVAKYYDGLPFGRLLFVDGFNQGPFFVRATPRAHPGGFQTQFNLTLDTRVAREFRLRRGVLSGYFDVFNVLNLDKNTLEADLTGPSFASRVPLAIQAPRAARLGVEWRF